MPKMTAASVQQAKPGQVRRELPDALCPGLYLVIQPSGAKSWAARYRFAGKPRKLTLGPYSDAVGLVEARDLARTALRAVAAGRDPHADKVEARRQEEIEAERKKTGVHLKASDRFETIWAAYVADHVSTFRERSKEEWARLHVRYLSPRWGKLTLGEITPAHVDLLLHGMRHTPDARDKSLSILVAFFNWTIQAPRRLLPASPCNGIQKIKRRKEDAGERERALSDEEIRWFWLACDRAGFPFGQVFRLLLLTGARLREVANMPESELKRAESIWNLSASRAKNGKAHTIHLSEASAAVLESVPRIGNKSGCLFSTNGKTPCSGFSRAKTRLDKNMHEAALAERGPKVTIEPWRIHDLRRTFLTGLAKLSIPIATAERCLNHISESHGGLRRVYDKHNYSGEMRAAFDAWGKYVTAIVSGKLAVPKPLPT